MIMNATCYLLSIKKRYDAYPKQFNELIRNVERFLVCGFLLLIAYQCLLPNNLQEIVKVKLYVKLILSCNRLSTIFFPHFQVRIYSFFFFGGGGWGWGREKFSSEFET